MTHGETTPDRTTRATPFEIAVPQAKLDRILTRVRDYEWPETPAGGDWNYGTNRDYLRELAAYWADGADGYDWRATEREMNRFAHFRAEVDGLALHYIHERGSGDNPQPLLLLHGWPYSFASFLGVIEPLARPERTGGDAADGFDVVVASLPGYGFSGKPAAPIGPRRMGELLDGLMHGVLGYGSYLVAGGDWGGDIASQMGFNHADRIAGVHSHSFLVRHAGAVPGSGQTGPGDATDDERAFVEGERQTFMVEGAYASIMGTRPQTLSYAMLDSPIGLAAWMIEKFYAWLDRRVRPFAEIFTRDQLLTEAMVYLVTDTANTASWIYSAFQQEGSSTLPPGERVAVPTGRTGGRVAGVAVPVLPEQGGHRAGIRRARGRAPPSRVRHGSRPPGDRPAPIGLPRRPD